MDEMRSGAPRCGAWVACAPLLIALSLAACDGAVAIGDAGRIFGDASATCGDGVLEPTEGCDDGNAVTGDGCSATCERELGVGAADEVVDAPGATGEGFRDPSRATNGVRGGGLTQQSLDVYSILPGEHLTLGWSGRRVVNGPGVDLAVFENPFRYADGLTFIDATVLELSDDGETWVELPHDYVAPDETVYSPHEEDWIGFAGVHPVLLHVDDNPVDPFDARAAGGDGFDLDDLPLDDPDAAWIRAHGFRFLRLSPAPSHENPDTGAPFLRDPVSDGPDIDGVIARWVVEVVP